MTGREVGEVNVAEREDESEKRGCGQHLPRDFDIYQLEIG